MHIQKSPKLFAFKLADKKSKEIKPEAQWKVRDGVSVAGCSAVANENYRYSVKLGSDSGQYC